MRCSSDWRPTCGPPSVPLTVDTHLEPIEDPSSYLDTQLDRTGNDDGVR